MKINPKHRDAHDYAENASKRHKLIGKVLSEGYFAHYKVQQETPVVSINPDHHNRRTKVDWYIPQLAVAIEVNGEQHYRPVDFGGAGKTIAKLKFVRGQHLDTEKVIALAEVGVGVVEIGPDDEITEEVLIKLISDAITKTIVSAVTRYKKSDSRTERAKELKREYNRKLYKRMKEARETK